jgi:hypothetical protein
MERANLLETLQNIVPQEWLSTIAPALAPFRESHEVSQSFIASLRKSASSRFQNGNASSSDDDKPEPLSDSPQSYSAAAPPASHREPVQGDTHTMPERDEPGTSGGPTASIRGAAVGGAVTLDSSPQAPTIGASQPDPLAVETYSFRRPSEHDGFGRSDGKEDIRVVSAQASPAKQQSRAESALETPTRSVRLRSPRESKQQTIHSDDATNIAGKSPAADEVGQMLSRSGRIPAAAAAQPPVARRQSWIAAASPAGKMTKASTGFTGSSRRSVAF